ncbi:hypothetical protein [Actinoplanes subglobosus]|uniref:Caspase domain-containing protein n=1 Tax=Actinoplanes subglobosus TaxID=1547892 RepID=A0ABV8JGD9_9ACTN
MRRIRRALCVGVPAFGSGARPVRQPLPFAPDRVAAVGEALRTFGYDVTVNADPEKLTGAELARAVREASDGLGTDDVLIIHIVTHGRLMADGALYLYGGDGLFHETGQIDHFVRQLGHSDGPQVLLLLDVCHAGAATRQPWQLRTGNERCWVLAACAPEDLAFNGRFSEAVANVLHGFGSGGAHVDAAHAHLRFTMVAAAIRREVKRLVDRDDAMSQEVVGTLRDVSADDPDLPFFPNRSFTATAGRRVRVDVPQTVEPFLADVDEALDPVHFMNRAGGRVASGAPADGPGCFSGRNEQLRELTDWCNGHGPRLRVVTGSPGVGKSALVGVVVCAAHPDLHKPTQRLWKDVAWTPFVNRRLVAVHARRRTITQIVASLATQLGLPDRDEWTVPGFLTAVAALEKPPFVVVDALDEAHRYEQVLEHLLLPMAREERPDGEPLCRLLVGMRPWPVFDELRRLAEESGGLLDLDRVDRDRLLVDLENYVVSLLRHHRPYDHRDFAAARGAFAAHLADALVSATRDGGSTHWGEFLVAGLYTYHVATALEPVRDFQAAAALGESAPRTLPDLLELDLRQRTNPWLRSVLTVIAYAHGEGMPAELIQDAAAAFRPDGITAVDGPQRNLIAEALNTVRFYLRATTDVDGTTLYRLFHQGLADYLRRGGDDPAVLAAALLAPLESMDGSGRRWDLAEPYLRRHAAAHCAEAGRSDLLDDDVEFLVHAGTAEGATWIDAAEHRRLREAAGPSTTSLRYALAVHASEQGDRAAARRLANPPGDGRLRWRPEWVVGGSPAPSDPGLIKSGPAIEFRLVKLSGRPYLTVLTAAGELSVWGGADRRPVWSRQLPPGHAPAISASFDGILPVDGPLDDGYGLLIRSGKHIPLRHRPDYTRPPSAMAGTESGFHQLWPSPGGLLLYRYSGGERLVAGWQPTELPVTACAAVAAGPWLHIVYTDGRSIRVLRRNLRKDLPATERVVGTMDQVDELACLLFDDELFVAARGSEVRVWPAPAAAPRRKQPVTCMTCDDGRITIGLADGTVTRFDAVTGTIHTRAAVHSAAVTAITAGPGDLTASADTTGTVAVVDWAARRTLYRGPAGPVSAMTMTHLGGRLLLIGETAGRLLITDVRDGRTTSAEGLAAVTSPRTATGLGVEARGSAVWISDPEADRLLDRIEVGATVDEVVVRDGRRLLVRAGGRVVLLAPNDDQANDDQP